MKSKRMNLLRLTDTVQQKIKKEKLFHSLQDLLLTVSGGQDSVFCLLLLYLLKNNKKLTWNRKKVTILSKRSGIEGTLIKQKLVSIPWLDFTFNQEKQVKDEMISHKYLTNLCVNNYTLLWCNHFWQKDSFFTMEHISKLTFCKTYVIYLFTALQPILSEQNGRNWRHKVVQRSSLFICREKQSYKSIELYYTSFQIIKTSLLISTKVIQNLINFTQHFLTKSALKSTVLPLCVQGHSKSDRAETILFNLIKGTGMNGLSTLQWKQTFLSPSHSNHTLYPIFEDFFKEIRVISLNSFTGQSYSQNQTKQSDKVRLTFFSKKSDLKTFYYQLQYEIKKI